ncbi:MAG: hypothetical protein C4582_02580 [Desulfobacteraceae bacterium]|nr:MAG: hypothetical protein C4582_02580 [Desulfobacteraceae bacterium]
MVCLTLLSNEFHFGGGATKYQPYTFPSDLLYNQTQLYEDAQITRITANQALNELSRHSGMPLAGIQPGIFLDSGQNRAGMTEGQEFS